MRKFDLEEAARTAVREGRPVCILDELIPTGVISIKMVAPEVAQDVPERVDQIANKNWEKIWADGLFNGVICAAQSIHTSGEYIEIDLVEIDYKTFRATDLIIEGVEGYFPPLAVGVHALLLGSQSILALRLADGTLGTPGGAVDVDDFAAGEVPFVNALLREIAEEAGIQTEQAAVKLCGAYIVHNPLHLVFVYVVLLEDEIMASVDVHRTLEEEKIVGIQPVKINEISSLPNSIHDALGLCISSASRLGYL